MDCSNSGTIQLNTLKYYFLIRSNRSKIRDSYYTMSVLPHLGYL